jgi:hypothetical protein
MEVLERMLQRHNLVTSEKYQKEDSEFIENVFGVFKPTAKPKLTRIHEVTRVKRTSNKRRYVDFYNLSGLLDYYEENLCIDKDDLARHYEIIKEHLQVNNYQENDIIFIGSANQDRQEVQGFALVTKNRKNRSFKIAQHPDDLFNGKKMYYGQAVEAMNELWNRLFGEDVISTETISDLAVNDMYEH